MSELSQEEVRRRRMARLAGLDSFNSTVNISHNNDPVSPNTPGPSKTFTDQIISPLKQQQFQNPELPMEIEENTNKQCSSSAIDIDSGIENMEVEESERKEVKPRSRTTSSSTEITTEQIHAVISRVLCISWKEPTEGCIFLPQMAIYALSTKFIDATEIINQALMEVLCMFMRDEDPLKEINIDTSSDREDSPNSQASPLQSPVTTFCRCDICCKSSQPKSLIYLLDCYSRVAIEERNHPKKSSIPPLSDILAVLRAQCVQYSSLVLQGLVGISQSSTTYPFSMTPLLYPVLSQSLPRGYLHELVTRTHTNSAIFNKIFTPLLQGLYLSMQQASLIRNTHRRPIEALEELIEICCGPSSNIRPICRLIVHQIQFLPDIMTSAAGKEITTTSLLGPFLSVSVFAEDQLDVAERFFSGNLFVDKSISLTLQQELESIRTSLHKIFHAILASSNCREAMLTYLATLLRYNEKRAQPKWQCQLSH